MVDTLSARPRKGRGAIGNPDNRYERLARTAVDDGWGTAEDDPPPLRTTVENDASRGVIARNDSPDIPFEQSINPYRGCEHGCVYCYARPSHAWLGLSPGLDFETRLFAKPEAPALLEKELRARSYRCQPIALGTNTDPYQPVERERRITRGLIEVLAAFSHPLIITTKSALVLRDLDLLGPMAARGLARVNVSVTTLDTDLCARLEPRAPRPPRRLEAIAGLAAAGVPVAVFASPLIPGLNDAELEAILAAGRDAGAREAVYMLVRLPREVEGLFVDWLEHHYPHRRERVLSLIRQCRGGALDDSRFASRMTGEGTYAGLMARRFALAIGRLGMVAARGETSLDCCAFRPPPRPGDQLALF